MAMLLRGIAIFLAQRIGCRKPKSMPGM